MTFSAEFASGVRATLTVSVRAVQCEWDPDLPRQLNIRERKALIESYRVWRDECLEEFATANNLEIQVFRVAGLDCIAFRQRAEVV